LCKPSISANAVAVRVAEISFPSVTESAVTRDVVSGDDFVGNAFGYVFLGDFLDGNLTAWDDDGNAAIGGREENFG
jgi:hypothetical protein